MTWHVFIGGAWSDTGFGTGDLKPSGSVLTGLV